MESADEPSPRKKRRENSEVFQRLMELRRPVPDLDEERELAEWREEKYGIKCAD